MVSLFQKVLSPVDFDEASVSAMKTAAEIVRLTGGKLFVLHVLARPISGMTPAQLDSFVRDQEQVRERLEKLCHDRLGDLPCEILTRTGDPAIAIIHAEDEIKPDLIVVATDTAAAKPPSFPGGVAERVIRESLCPVLMVRPGAAGDPATVGMHMTAAPFTLLPETPVARVQQMMARDRFRWAPVVADGSVVGIVTDRDLASSDADPATAIGLLMTRDVVTVTPATSLQEAARELLECEVDGLPVVEDGKLVGVITRSDILKVFAGVEPIQSKAPHR